MLYFVVVWTGLLLACLTIGCGCLHGLRADRLRRRSQRALLSVWLGLGIMSVVMLAVALVAPLSPLIGASVWLLGMLFALVSSPSVRSELMDWARWCAGGFSGWHASGALWGYGLCCGAIAAFVSQKVTWLDTGQYHYGFVRWFSEYGVVPGLVLLNPQFGFVSAWFALTAPFNPTGLEGRASTVMNGFILLLAMLQIAMAGRHIVFARMARQREQLNDWFLLTSSLVTLLLLTQTPFLSAITVSASPDIAIALFTVIVAWSMLVVGDGHLGQQQALIDADFIPVILAIAACSIKLTALPLLVIAASFTLFRRPSLRRWLTGSAFMGGLMLPFLIIQVLVSGCWLYPSSATCLPLPWTRSIAMTQALAAATHGWENWFGAPPVGAHRSLWLIQQWLNSNQSSKLIALLIVLSIASGIYLVTRLRGRQGYAFFWLLMLSIVGIAFMMLKAPLFRFGMGYALVLPMLSVALLCEWASWRLKLNLRLQALSPKTLQRSLLVMGVFYALVLNAQSYQTVRDRLFVAPPLPSVVLHWQTLNGITYAVTQDQRNQCWSAQLPCVAIAQPDVKLRNPELGIKGGFIRDP